MSLIVLHVGANSLQKEHHYMSQKGNEKYGSKPVNQDHRMFSDILVNVFLFHKNNVLVGDVPGESLE